MMIGNWPMSKDDLYGPPPAYSSSNHFEHLPAEVVVPSPPSYTPSVYIVPLSPEYDRQERASSHVLIILPRRFTRYLLATGLVHMVIGLTCIVCDVILTIMNESYSFNGLWAGGFSILLGIYLILFISRPEKHICSLERLRFFHLILCLITIVALVLASINLASDSCYKIFLGPDRCQHSAYVIKILLVISFSLTFVQLSFTICWISIHSQHLRAGHRTTSDIPN